MTQNLYFPAASASRPVPLAAAVRAILAGGLVIGLAHRPARAELPVPADILVGAGKGQVLPPVISGNNMTIIQKSEKAILDWKSFNIGPANSVEFKQPGATSVALNNIQQGDPSRIFGKLTANGQVYLVNQNGFVFGKDARVNVNTLVASTLNISEDAFKLGLARVFNETKGAALAATDAQGNAVNQLYLRGADGQPVVDQNGQKVKVQIFVDSGASIKTNGRDGRIILAAPSIDNRGTIQAPDGQIILAAAQDKVYLQQADSNSDLRGLLVEVGTGGDVNNVGKILAERGNASLIGFAVNQNGLVSATTSVNLNGTVRLLAREGIKDVSSDQDPVLAPFQTQRAADLEDGLGTRAKVTLGKGSLTSVELDADKAETALDAQKQTPSRIEIAGHGIHLEGGSEVRVHSGKVGLEAVDNPAEPLTQGTARIYLDQGSRIDVSGVKNVPVPVSRNVVEVELRKNELRDAPLQRDGVLYGKKVYVDVRDVQVEYVDGPNNSKVPVGRIPLAVVQGSLDRIARNIDERSTAGGSIDLTSSGDVLSRPGSLLDVSGGSVAYQSGYVQTTQLISDGQIFDIGTADPNRHYDAILGEIVRFHSKYGVAERWSSPALRAIRSINPSQWRQVRDSSINIPGLARFEEGYVEGKDGGTIDIAAYNAMLDGLLEGRTVDGPLQREPGTRAKGSRLEIDLNRNIANSRQDAVFARAATVDVGFGDPFPKRQEPQQREIPLSLDPETLRASGMRHVALKVNGSVYLPADSRLELPASRHLEAETGIVETSSLEVEAAGTDLQGVIAIPSGKVSFGGSTVDGPQPANPIDVGPGAQILVNGNWVNDRRPGTSGLAAGPISIDGGKVELTSEQGDLRVSPGSRIDAGGGAWLAGDGELIAGKGGSISLTAQTAFLNAPADRRAPSLHLGGELSGWALEHGASLLLASDSILIGDPAVQAASTGKIGSPLRIGPDFFRSGGFGDYTLTANAGSLEIAPGTTIEPRQSNLVLPDDRAALPSADSLAAVTARAVLPDAVRQPASLSLRLAQTAVQNQKAILTVGKGAAIRTDPLAAITLESDTSIQVEGSLNAPAGKIELEVTPPADPQLDSGFFASQGIWLGPESALLAQGAVKLQPDPLGLRRGEVLPGGMVELKAARGYVVTDRFSRIDVSGTEAPLDFPATGSKPPETRSISSSGGAIKFTGGQGVIADGAVYAASGGKGSGGGTFELSLDSSLRAVPFDTRPELVASFPNNADSLAPSVITVSDSAAPALPSDVGFGGDIPSDRFSQRGLVSDGRIAAGGFGSVKLKTDALSGNNFIGRVELKGGVRLTAEREIVIDSPSLTAVDTNHAVIDAPRVALGSTRSADGAADPVAPVPKAGEASLDVNAQLIDVVGGVSLDGFGQTRLNSSGDLRALGVLNTAAKAYRSELRSAGDVAIRADRIYPTTLTDFAITLAPDDPATTLTIFGGDSQKATAPLYSAGGSLSFSAPNIIQSGAILVPFGQIRLNASSALELSPGSLTSVSGGNTTVLFGRGAGDLEWLYPLGGSSNKVLAAPPEKRISLSGPSVSLRPGATVDLQGGGDLYGYEFISGPGGTNDVLDPTAPGYTAKYAVIPGIGGIATPYDPLEFKNAGLGMGDSVFLKGGAGLPAGRYTLLPARYALLPGAFLVTPEPSTRDLDPSRNLRRLDGATIVPGRFAVAGTDIIDDRWQGFAVEPGAVARTRSEYKDYSANQFFAALAAKAENTVPRLPQDAGTLALSPAERLSLGAEVRTASPYGRGGQVDIDATRLAVIGRREDQSSAPEGTVTVLAQDLNRLNAASLLLGGTRSQEADGDRVTVGSRSVSVSGDAAVLGPETILAAKDEVRLEAGAWVQATGASGAAGPDLLVSNSGEGAKNSDGALLRVSSAGQVDVIRDGTVTGAIGDLTVEAGAHVEAAGSVFLDSTRDARFDGDLAMSGGALAVRSSSISVGDAPADTGGLVLKQIPAGLDELRLASNSDFNLFGAAQISTGKLDLSAAQINGFGNDGLAAAINAATLRLSNPSAKSAISGDGTGTLNVSAGRIELGGGGYAIRGFNQVNLAATEALMGGIPKSTDSSKSAAVKTAEGPGSLTVAGGLSLSAGHFSGYAGSTTTLDATGYALRLDALTAPADTASTTGLGAGWNLRADSIAGAGRFDLPAGDFSLTALQGGIELAAGTRIDVGGREISFGSQTRYTPAGNIRLAATGSQGDVKLDAGSELNLAGAAVPAGVTDGTADAGTLDVQAPTGQFDWQGTVSAGAVAGSRSGQFHADVAGFNGADFGTVNGRIAAAGFADEINVRQRSGDIALPAGATVRARQVDLQTDTASLVLQGRIDASGTEGGSVSLRGTKGVTLAQGASIDAHATAAGGAGGKVLLDSVAVPGSVSDSGDSGLLDLAAGSSIDVSGGSGGTGGSVHLRAGRVDATGGVNASPIGTNIIGSADTVLEAVRVYRLGVEKDAIDGDFINGWRQDTQAFMAKAVAPQNLSGTALILSPGLDIRRDGDLSLAAVWDFAARDPDSGAPLWRYGGVPGYLSLWAQGDLKVNASLNDGFDKAPSDSIIPVAGSDVLQTGKSWSYRLGADGHIEVAGTYAVSDADPNNPDAPSERQVVVRTGTGDIALAAGGNVVFKPGSGDTGTIRAAAVYTVGRAAEYSLEDLLLGKIPGIPGPQAGESMEQFLARQEPSVLAGLRWGTLTAQERASMPYAEFPQDGGDVSLRAGGDVQGVATAQSAYDWLVRFGGSSDDPNQAGLNTPTFWGINVSGTRFDTDAGESLVHEFNQNAGALGGGDVSVTAGGAVSNLWAASPTTGRPTGQVTFAPGAGFDPAALTGETAPRRIDIQTAATGGGDLQIRAGGDVRGGNLLAGSGRATVEAAGAIEPVTESDGGLIAQLGDTQLSLRARAGLTVGAVFDPLLVPRNVAGANILWSNYGPKSGLDALAAGGSIVFRNDRTRVKIALGWNDDRLDDLNANALRIYPGSLSAAAFSGDLRIENSMTLYPSSEGRLELLAARSIGISEDGRGQVSLAMSDADPNLLATPARPVSDLGAPAGPAVFKRLELGDPDPARSHAATPLHQGRGNVASVVARDGDIATGNDGGLTLNLPMAAHIQAGGKIENLSVNAQNLSATDITRIEAGKSIGYGIKFDNDGQLITQDQRFALGGPGRLQLIAGGDINLGGSQGVLSAGNLFNPSLPASDGAAIDVLAGLSDKLDADKVIETFLKPDGPYLRDGGPYGDVIVLPDSGAISPAAAAPPTQAGALPANARRTDAAAAAGTLERIRALPADAKLAVAAAVLFNEIKQSAKVAAAAPEGERRALYQRGFDAIKALFPGDQYQGDVSLVFSQIKTIADGEINIAAPGGKMDAGLAVKFAGLNKSADQLGIVVQGKGNLNAVTQGDFNVNQSRVFTLGGGDIVVWSSKGDIDAGKGAKTALSAPPPITTLDASGNPTTIFPPILSGSGIQAVNPSGAGVRQGSVYLAAPVGVVDAGEAGISGNNVVIAATAVIGASNIQASGGTVGVPTAVAPPVIPGGISNAAAGVAKAATQTAGLDGSGKDTEKSKDDAQRAAAQVSVLSTDVVGYGKCSVADVREGKPGCGG